MATVSGENADKPVDPETRIAPIDSDLPKKRTVERQSGSMGRQTTTVQRGSAMAMEGGMTH